MRVLNASAAHVYYRIHFVLNNSGGEDTAAGGAADVWNATSLLVVSASGSVRLLKRVLQDGNGNSAVILLAIFRYSHVFQSSSAAGVSVSECVCVCVCV